MVKVNAAVYCRISADREGAGLGVERQRTDCEALARQRGWTVIGVYVDNDISAYSGKVRPEYRRLLEDIRADKVAAIIAWHTDRLHRSPRELEEFIDLCDAHHVHVETVRAGELDLKTPAGRAVARTLGAWARYESEHRSERIRRKMAELAEHGRPHGGGLRCYGYAADKVTIIPEEAAVLREAAERVLAGEPVRAVCMDFNRRGLGTSTGGKWAVSRLHALLVAPRIAGLRKHPSSGEVPAQWPAIITAAQHTRLVALLTDQSRRTSPGPARRHLLSGILRCGECGARMVGFQPGGGAWQRRPQYRCAPQEHRGCGKIAISQHLVEPFIVEAVLSTLDNLRIDDQGVRPDEAEDVEAMASDRAQLDELASLYAERAITAQEWIRARAQIEDRIAQRNRRIADHAGDERLRDLLRSGTDLREAWPKLPLQQQRSILLAVLDRVDVSRARVRQRFEPDRLVPVWRV